MSLVKHFILTMLFANVAFSITALDSNKLPSYTFNEAMQLYCIDQCKDELIKFNAGAMAADSMKLVYFIVLSDCPKKNELVPYLLKAIPQMPSAAYVIFKEKFPEHKEELFKHVLEAKNPWIRDLCLANDPELLEYVKKCSPEIQAKALESLAKALDYNFEQLAHPK